MVVVDSLASSQLVVWVCLPPMKRCLAAQLPNRHNTNNMYISALRPIFHNNIEASTVQVYILVVYYQYNYVCMMLRAADKHRGMYLACKTPKQSSSRGTYLNGVLIDFTIITDNHLLFAHLT